MEGQPENITFPLDLNVLSCCIVMFKHNVFHGRCKYSVSYSSRELKILYKMQYIDPTTPPNSTTS